MLHKNEKNNTEQVQMVSIEQLVPKDHILRKIDKYIYFNFIYDLVEDKYSQTTGRSSIDPVVLIKLVILQYFFNINSMRQTIREVEVNIVYHLHKLAVQITAEFGDLSKFKNKKSLISFVGIDSPPYESGNFKADQRKITKRGNAILRKVGYQAMKCMMSAKDPENDIYLYMVKKENDGKAKKVCKFAGLNKFLRIYYAKVMASKQEKKVLKVA